MFDSIISKIASLLITPIVAISGWFNPAPEMPGVGTALPEAVAIFETSLASPITANATTMTLTANSIRGGGSLSGFNCFTIDEGSAQAEFVCGTVATTTVSGLTRGVSPADGITEDTDLQFSHRRGANVKITDFPIIQRLKLQNNGEGTYENLISYAAGVTPSSGSNLTDKEYVDGLAFSGAGVIQATTIDDGVVEIATALETASGTITGGSSANLVVPSSVATSTAPSSGHVIPVTGIADGNLAEGFLPTTLAQNYTLTGSSTFTGTTTFAGTITGHASTTITQYTASTTWSKPAGLEYIIVEVIGGGGGGGAEGANNGAGGGGGAGGYSKEVLTAADLAATSTVTITIGGGGAGGAANGDNDGITGGTTSFSSFLQATGGIGGTAAPGGGGGGTGGTGSGGDVNITSGNGESGYVDAGADTGVWAARLGGSTIYGSSCGGGGTGGLSNGAGSAGNVGCVIIQEVF